MAYLLGLDIGTSSAKALVIDEAGNEISSGASGYDIKMPCPGYAEQDCEMLWKAVCTAAGKALRDADVRKKVAAVGVTGQMHGLVTLGENKEPLYPIIIWADRRSVEQIRRMKGSGVEERASNPITAGFFLPSLLWLKEKKPELYGKVKYTLLPKDYIRYRLCGNLGTDYSDATGTLLFDTQKGVWDEKTLESFSIHSDILPVCHHSYERAGNITAKSGAFLGLPEGIPVVYGGGDTPMQLAGNGIIRSGQLNTNIGTGSQINCVCDFLPAADSRVNIFHHVLQDMWLAAGASLNGGVVIKWLQKNILHGFDNFEAMSSTAANSVPGANGVVFLPFLSGERSPYMDEKAKAVLYGMTLSTDRKDIIRAAMESVVYSFRDCIRVFEDMNLPMEDRIIASGGGARSGLWLQMQADILQKAVYTTAGDTDAGKGAALAAGVGCGIYHSFEEACGEAVRLSGKIYEPDLSYRQLYEDRFAVYVSLYKRNKELFWQF